MKNTLTRILKALVFPLLTCRRIILEASQICCDYDPIGFSDYIDFAVSDREPAARTSDIRPRKQPLPAHCAATRTF